MPEFPSHAHTATPHAVRYVSMADKKLLSDAPFITFLDTFSVMFALTTAIADCSIRASSVQAEVGKVARVFL